VQTIDSWSTADLYLAYATDRAANWLNDVTIALSVTNLTDEEPPFVDIPAAITLPNENVLPFDAANASALGRFVALQITKRW
jgi:iron complex outermembrane receptor protein